MTPDPCSAPARPVSPALQAAAQAWVSSLRPDADARGRELRKAAHLVERLLDLVDDLAQDRVRHAREATVLRRLLEPLYVSDLELAISEEYARRGWKR